MGASISNNVAKDTQAIVASVTNDFTQQCTQSTSNDQTIDLSKCKGVKIDRINLSENIAISTKCVQNNSTQNQIKEAITTQLTQQAKSVTQALGLPSVNIANNIVENAAKVGEQVSNTFSQTCVNDISSSQRFNCSDSQNVTIGVIDFQNNQQALTDCVQKNDAVNKAIIEYKNVIGQTAAAKQADNFATAAIFFLVILGIFAYVFVQTLKSEAVKWIVIGIVIVVVLALIAYTYSAYENNRWPFQQKTTS
jgi:hypothetical protein